MRSRSSRLAKLVASTVIAGLGFWASAGPITLSSSSTYTQNFNSLSSAATGTVNTWTNDSTIAGWYTNAVEYYTTNGSMTSANRILSMGVDADSDRALGIHVGIGARYMGAQFKNNIGDTLNDVTISFTGEQWRKDTTATPLTLIFEWSKNATTLTDGTWNAVTDLNFNTPQNGAPAGPVSPLPQTASLSKVVTGMGVAQDGNFWLRWRTAGSFSRTVETGIDDFQIVTPVPLPNAAAMGLTGLTAIGLLIGKRRQRKA